MIRVGDRVRVKQLTEESCPSDKMEKYVGETGTVFRAVSQSRIPIDFDDPGLQQVQIMEGANGYCRWNWSACDLERIEEAEVQ